MRYSLITATLVATCAAHGIIRSIQGANGVSMPGLSVADGTPRDCSVNECGSQADTAIIRDEEITSGRTGPLGRTQGNGPVMAEPMVANFMGTGPGPASTKNRRVESGGQVDHVDAGAALGGDKNNSDSNGKKARQLNEGIQGDLPPEDGVASSAGKGRISGLPTASDSGVVTLTYRQIDQDGAGPLTAAIDATSGGTDPNAFRSVRVTHNVPGGSVSGLSSAIKTDFTVGVQMPEGMTCEGTIAGVKNVCIVRVRNSAISGPFGGSAAFTQSATARKRAIAYRLKKRMELGREMGAH